MDIESLKILGICILLLPAVAAAVAAALGSRQLKGATHWPVIAGVGGAAVCSILLLRQVAGVDAGSSTAHISVYDWMSAGGGAWFQVRFMIDPLTAIMLCTVTFISTLVVIYARDYMRHHDHPERGYERFFAFLAMFVFSMCALVLGGNFLLLYLGWELVGLCSYLLIGFYYDKPPAAAAAKKAFLVNRIGDFGFGLGILLIYLTFGRLDYAGVFEAARLALDGGGDAIASLAGMYDISVDAATQMATTIADRLPIVALLLFCGAAGKSAQIPLYVWLPDAMEGPTPVSALIHAATMVTAGVYMVARCGVIFTSSVTVMTLIAAIGAITALFAATIALTQYDMKRILAYSTISQLGYMFLGLGAFAASSAIFHLFTHAFFKALLFLAAGSVMHAMGGVIDVRRFGGLRRVLPFTFAATMIGSLALAGFPLLSGFWSKDEILHHAFAFSPVLGVIGLVTAVLTAFYTFRMVFLAFWGEQRVPDGVSPHESGPWILTALGVLSIGALFAGFANVHFAGGGFLGFLEPGGSFGQFLSPALEPFEQYHHGGFEHVVAAGAAAHDAAHGAGEAATSHGFFGAIAHHWMMYLSSLIAIGGIIAAYYFYVARPWLPGGVLAAFPKAHRVLYHKYYVDEMYDRVIVVPLRRLGSICFSLDEYFIDGIVWLVTVVPRAFGFVGRSLQGGALQGYGVSMITGLAIIMVWLMLG